MKLKLINTVEGLKPLYDEDYDEKKKLKLGVVYDAVVKETRNIKFHRLYFSMINCSWSYLTEKQQAFFHDSVDAYRKTVEMAAGHYELHYSVNRREWIECPKSIAFDKLDESAFSTLYERVKDVIYNTFIPQINKSEFEEQLKYF